MTTTPVKRTRGRPRKASESPISLADGLELPQIDLLRQQIAKAFPALTASQIDQLTPDISSAVAAFRGAIELRKRVKGHKTNKPKVHIAILIADCGRAYASATGKSLTRWSARDKNLKKIEAAALRLTRIAAEIATGKPMTQDLRRQAALANDTGIEPI